MQPSHALALQKKNNKKSVDIVIYFSVHHLSLKLASLAITATEEAYVTF